MSAASKRNDVLDKRPSASKNHHPYQQLKKRISELEYLNLQDEESNLGAGRSNDDAQRSAKLNQQQQQPSPPLPSGASVAAATAATATIGHEPASISGHLHGGSPEGHRANGAAAAAAAAAIAGTNCHRHDSYAATPNRLATNSRTNSSQRLTGIDENDDDDEDDDDDDRNNDGADDEADYDASAGASRSSNFGPLAGHSRLTKNLAWTVLASTVGASFQHGYNGGVVNAPEKLIARFINDTYQARYGQYASDSQLDLLFAIIVAIFCIGGCLGACMTPLVADRLGRKQGLWYNNVIVLLACPLMASARSLASYELLIIGRLLIGINAGLNAGLAPLYMNEISPINLRGALGTIYQLIITVSILLSNVFGLPSLLGTDEHWPILFAIPILPALFMLFALPNCFESPKHLLLNRGHELQAQQALAWFRETGEVQDEMEELKLEQETAKMAPAVNLAQMLRQKSLRKPLTVAIVIMLSQQFSGINAVLFYSTSIFRSAGLSQYSAVRATLGMSLVNVSMTIVSLFLVDRAGRRTLHMCGLMGMAWASIVLALCLGGQPEESTVHGSASSIIAVMSVYVFIIMFASGPGSIPWFLVAELFPSNARPLASGIAVAVNWLANFTVSLCFLPLSNVLHGFTFFVFAILLFIFYLFTYYKVPETKGATAEEISALFKR